MDTYVRQLQEDITQMNKQIVAITLKQQQQEKAMEYMARVIDRMKDKPTTYRENR